MKNPKNYVLCVFAVIVLSVALFAVAAASGYEFKAMTSGNEQTTTTGTGVTEEIPEWATRPAQELTEELLYYRNLRIDEPQPAPGL